MCFRGYKFLLHNTTVLYTDVTAISAQNNFQGLILGGYIYRYTPVATALTVAGVCAVPSVLWAASQLVTSNHRTNPPVVLLSARRTSSSASDLDDVWSLLKPGLVTSYDIGLETERAHSDVGTSYSYHLLIYLDTYPLT